MATAKDRADLSEAEARYFDRVVEDCAGLLGSGVDVDDLEIVEGPAIVLRLRYHLGTVTWTSEGRGPTITAAHGALREQLVVDRLKVSMSAVYRAGR